MKKLNFILKAFVFVSILFAAASGCKKDDPYSPEKEAADIKAWIAKLKTDNVEYDSTDTKIYYILDKTKVGTGPNVKVGNTVTVKYSGTFVDGSVFDSSNSYKYVHKGTNQGMIAGWVEGIELLNKGSRATFLIPSSLAYGSGWYYSIPPYSPLIFVIEVIDIK